MVRRNEVYFDGFVDTVGFEVGSELHKFFRKTVVRANEEMNVVLIFYEIWFK